MTEEEQTNPIEVLQKLDTYVHKYIEWSQGKEENEPEAVPNDQIWKAIHQFLIDGMLDFFARCIPLVSFHMKAHEEFINEQPDFIKNDFSILQNPDAKEEKKLKTLQIYIVMLPFLSAEQALDVLEPSLDYVQKYLQENSCLPLKFLKMYRQVVTENLQPDTFKAIMAFIKEEMNGERRISAIAVYSYISYDAVQIQSQYEKMTNQLINDLITSEDRDDQMVCCLLLQQYAYHYELEQEQMPEEDTLSGFLLPLLVIEDKALQNLGHKAIRALIRLEAFQNNYEMLNQIFALNEKYTEDTISQFFKILEVYIIPTGEKEFIFKPRRLKPIRKFVADKLSQPDVSDVIKANCINLTSELMALKPDFVEKLYPIALEEAKRLIEEKCNDLLYLITPLVAGCAKYFPASLKTWEKQIQQLCTLIGNEKNIIGKPHDHYNIAINISEVIKSGISKNSASTLTSLASNVCLLSSNPTIRLQGCALIINLVKSMNSRTVDKTFEKVFVLVQESNDVKSFTLGVKTLRVLIKHQIVKNSHAKDFMTQILDQEVPLFKGRLPMFNPQMVKYLVTFAKKYPKQSREIQYKCMQYCKIAEFCPFMLRPINATLIMDSFDPQFAPVLAKQLITIISSKFKGDKYILPVKHCVETLTLLYNKRRSVFKPLEEYMEPVMKFIEMAEVTDSQIIVRCEPIPEIAEYIFDIYATDPNVEIETDMLLHLIDFLPFPPEVIRQQKILDYLIRMTSKQMRPRFDFLVSPLAQIIAKILLLKPKKFAMFTFKEFFIKNMKLHLKYLLSYGEDTIMEEITSNMTNQKEESLRLQEILDEKIK